MKTEIKKERQEIGSVGGKACLKKHGKSFYSDMKKKWWREHKAKLAKLAKLEKSHGQK